MIFYKFKGECIIRTPDILEIKIKYWQTGIPRMKIRTIIITALSLTIGLTIGMMFLRADLSRAIMAETGKTTNKSFLESELIFPLEHWHNHASSIVEASNGDLIVCWFNGSGERQADDVKVEGARKRKGAAAWSARFTMADTPG